MNRTIKQVLEGREENHVLPFFWQHGEDEQTLREMMAAIHGANCGAVCVESRPHPDFCGDKWWADMDVILDEARKRGMKVWILDDSHFPTGYANGAVLKAPEALCKQAVYLKEADLPEEKTGLTLDLRAEGLMDAPQKQYDNPVLAAHFTPKPERIFGDDRVLRAVLVYADGREEDVTAGLSGETLTLQKAQGAARLRVLVITRNAGYHRHYINLLSADSVRLLIDAVYEPHWQHYAADFGKTIAGFFSDEPELGNGAMYEKGNTLGKVLDLPWSAEMEERLPEALGADWQAQLERLWRQDDSRETARVHAVYMDLLTQLVRKNFSEQLGNWCRDHGVQYIGHMIEDDGQHCHTGSSLAHYFRGLQGEDMSGIDDIGGQVLPQGEDIQVKPPQRDLLSLRSGQAGPERGGHRQPEAGPRHVRDLRQLRLGGRRAPGEVSGGSLPGAGNQLFCAPRLYGEGFPGSGLPAPLLCPRAQSPVPSLRRADEVHEPRRHPDQQRQAPGAGGGAVSRGSGMVRSRRHAIRNRPARAL